MCAVSGRRDSAPGLVMTAISSSTMATSSTKTESGRSSSAGSDSTRQPDSRQRLLVRAVLRPRARDVDRLALEVRQLTSADAGAHSARDRDQHGVPAPLEVEASASADFVEALGSVDLHPSQTSAQRLSP